MCVPYHIQFEVECVCMPLLFIKTIGLHSTYIYLQCTNCIRLTKALT